jgi:micrococcal nuclease
MQPQKPLIPPPFSNFLRGVQGLFLFTVLLYSSASARAETVSGRVVGVIDGDTIDLLINGRTETVRLFGIDCPEGGQVYGQKAKQFTSAMVYGKTVSLARKGIDLNGRTVGTVDIGGRSLEEILVRGGYAWYFKSHASNPVLAGMEQEARSQRRGLWAYPAPVPPWVYRHRDGEIAGSSSRRSGKTVQNLESRSEQTTVVYHGNIVSHKFRRPSCQHYNCKNCTAEFSSREEAIRALYVPCGTCNP